MSDLAIITLAELLDDIERVRIETTNRLGALRKQRGAAHPRLELLAEGLVEIEHEAELELRRAWRLHPLAPWGRSIPGLGEKQFARLIAIIGDPAERANPGKLLAYCGHGDPARRRREGMSQAEVLALGNAAAKKRVYLIAAQFRRTPGSPYRTVYDEFRAKYAERTHETACKRCGPKGKPAPAGSPWSAAHQDAAALRGVGHVFLVDLWREARLLRGLPVTSKRGKRGGVKHRKAALVSP